MRREVLVDVWVVLRRACKAQMVAVDHVEEIHVGRVRKVRIDRKAEKSKVAPRTDFTADIEHGVRQPRAVCAHHPDSPPALPRKEAAVGEIRHPDDFRKRPANRVDHKACGWRSQRCRERRGRCEKEERGGEGADRRPVGAVEYGGDPRCRRVVCAAPMSLRTPPKRTGVHVEPTKAVESVTPQNRHSATRGARTLTWRPD